MREKSFLSIYPLWIGLILLFTGCDQTFNPLQENDKYYFSFYGYLDAAADTQWVRVGPARQDLNEFPDSAGVEVTLEELQSGKTVLMNDSLSSSKGFLNYWTTMPLENEHTYRIKAERTDGKSSQVTVTIPRELPTPFVLENTFPPQGFFIYIDDSVEHVADVQSKWYVFLKSGTEQQRRIYTFSYRNKVRHADTYGGVFYVFAQTSEERGHITQNLPADAEFKVLHKQFFVASGGPEWDDNISSVNDLEYFLNGTASDVENGLGYVVGIDSKWMEYKTCYTPDSSNVAPCEPEDPFWYHE